jgi:lipoic acid synthetase
LDLSYIVVTSVDRDDLSDGGAGHFAEAIRALHRESPRTLVEVLIPDFQGVEKDLSVVAQAKPQVIAHNIETVERLTPTVRDRRASYRQSLRALEFLKSCPTQPYTKSSIMVGLGETEAELEQTCRDLRQVGVDVLTFGQYLQPSPFHLKVERFVTPDEFAGYQRLAQQLGFLYVASGPLVRSSYRAGELFLRGLIDADRSA